MSSPIPVPNNVHPSPQSELGSSWPINLLLILGKNPCVTALELMMTTHFSRVTISFSPCALVDCSIIPGLLSFPCILETSTVSELGLWHLGPGFLPCSICGRAFSLGTGCEKGDQFSLLPTQNRDSTLWKWKKWEKPAPCPSCDDSIASDWEPGWQGSRIFFAARARSRTSVTQYCEWVGNGLGFGWNTTDSHHSYHDSVHLKNK